ncbi:unnamed protein product, partial [Rodentolepis nana]|uniref:EF-hand domain-containing protein n=1 Tax=Rodentolepis nana TaxID=102285 RepID=A0A0R3TJ56_RODNA
MPCPKAVKELLEEFDKDGSGKIDAEELLKALQHLGFDLAQVKAFIRENDKNGDGQLDYKE